MDDSMDAELLTGVHQLRLVSPEVESSRRSPRSSRPPSSRPPARTPVMSFAEYFTVHIQNPHTRRTDLATPSRSSPGANAKDTAT